MTRPAESVQPPDLSQAFPERLQANVRAVLKTLAPGTDPQRRSPGDIGVITLRGQRLRIPHRLYSPEPDWASVRSLQPTERSIVACLYTRHHDGYVRERALAQISPLDETWVAPFVIQLLGEYVIELVEQAASLIEEQPATEWAIFVRENPDFLRLTRDRATSYWNVYYRRWDQPREWYPAFRAIATLINRAQPDEGQEP